MSESPRAESFGASLRDATSFWNILMKLVFVVVFGVIVATPYLVYNLDVIGIKAATQGMVWWKALFSFVSAFFRSSWVGFGIGLNTFVDTFYLHIIKGDLSHWGANFVSFIVLVFGTWTVYQPIRLLMNIFDMQKGRLHKWYTVMLISVVFLIFILAPLVYVLSDGQTISDQYDKVEDPDGVVGGFDNQTNESLTGNQSDLYYVTMTI